MREHYFTFFHWFVFSFESSSWISLLIRPAITTSLAYLYENTHRGATFLKCVLQCTFRADWQALPPLLSINVGNSSTSFEKGVGADWYEPDPSQFSIYITQMLRADTRKNFSGAFLLHNTQFLQPRGRPWQFSMISYQCDGICLINWPETT